jgi:hypothetical protein
MFLTEFVLRSNGSNMVHALSLVYHFILEFIVVKRVEWWNIIVSWTLHKDHHNWQDV